MDGWNTSFFLGSGLFSGPTKQHEPVKYSLVVMPLRISDHFSCPEIYQVCLCYAFQWYHSTCFSPPHCSKKKKTWRPHRRLSLLPYDRVMPSVPCIVICGVKQSDNGPPPPNATPPGNKALIRPYWVIMVVNNPLIRPYFLFLLGGGIKRCTLEFPWQKWWVLLVTLWFRGWWFFAIHQDDNNKRN